MPNHRVGGKQDCLTASLCEPLRSVRPLLPVHIAAIAIQRIICCPLSHQLMFAKGFESILARCVCRSNLMNRSFRWGVSHLPVPRVGTWLMERCGPAHVLLAVWMGCPNQTGGLQGRPCVSRGGLAGSDSGTGPGWQQSRQN